MSRSLHGSGAIIVSDTFVRANSATLGNADTGQAWTSAGFGITSNQAVNNNTDVQVHVAQITPGISDMVVECRMTRNTSRVGIQVRNRFNFWCDSTNYNLHDNSGVGIVASVSLASTISWGATATRTMRIVAIGSSIKCYVDDMLIFTLNDTTNQTNTTCGMYGDEPSPGGSNKYLSFYVYDGLPRFNPLSLLTNLISYWKCDENTGTSVADSLGGNTGTFASGAWTPGKINSGLNLNNANQVIVGNPSNLQITSSFSIRLFYQRANTTRGTTTLLSKGVVSSPSATAGYAIHFDGNGRIQLRVSSDGTSVFGPTTVGIWDTDLNLHELVVTYDAPNGVARFYIDGNGVGATTGGPSSIFNNSISFRIGAGSNNSDSTVQRFVGMEDEVSIWSRVLTWNEIIGLTTTGQYPFSRVVSGARTLSGGRTLYT